MPPYPSHHPTTLAGAGPIDALLLALHGSMVATCEPDVEGHLLALLREVLGPNKPLVATLDLHANITARMVANADVLVLYHTAPHVDVMNTGRRGTAGSASLQAMRSSTCEISLARSWGAAMICAARCWSCGSTIVENG